MSFPFVQAKPISYGAARSLKSVKYIVIHNTGNDGDTAKGNASFFHRHGDGNERYAGAHFFVDQQGNVYQTIKLGFTAWAVGDGLNTKRDGAASLYGICTNSNSVSIELCDIVRKDPSADMIKATKKVIKYIREYCPNATKICRHWDVSGKPCPERMTGHSDAGKKRWQNLLKALGESGGHTTTAKKSAPYPTADLNAGDTGSQVKRLQRCLNKIDKAGLTIDGSYGPATLKAVKHFKRKHMASSNPGGNVGPKTRAKIKELLK